MIKNKTALGSLFVSVIALVLSQFNPIPSWFAKPDFKIEISSNLQLSHFMGEIFIMPFIEINNIGKEIGQINRIEFYLESKDGITLKKKLSNVFCFSKPSSISHDQIPTGTPFTTISLAPNETWSAYLNVQSIPTTACIATNTQIYNKAVNEIGFYNPNVKSRNEVSNQLFNQIKGIMSDRLKDFTIGDYYLLLCAWSNDKKKPALIKTYTFGIQENQLGIFNQALNCYKYGEYIVRPGYNQSTVFVQLNKLNDDEIKNRLLKNSEQLP